MAIADGQGVVNLRWHRNENREGTTFLVQAQTTPGGEWAIIGATTKVKFRHQAVLGTFVSFRVTAQRASRSSPPSTPFSLWSGRQIGLAA